MQIEPYSPDRLAAVIRLSLRSWAPIFESLQKSMELAVYRGLYPDWRVNQQEAVECVCTAQDTRVWIASEASLTVGFVALKLHAVIKLWEIHMIAVDPDFQRRGIGTALTRFALDRMSVAGKSVAMVETGGDSGHDPARRTYERLGFRLLPIARYFKKL